MFLARGGTRWRILLLAALLGLAGPSLGARSVELTEPVAARWMTVDGVRVRYFDSAARGRAADGPVLLFVHGYCGSGSHFGPLFPLLGDAGRCIAVDLPGCAASEKPDVAYSISFFVEFLDSFRRGLALDRVVLVGHSLGGQVAVHYAHRFPQNVEKLVLLAPDGLAGEEGIWLAATQMGSFLEAAFSLTNRSMVELALRAVIFGEQDAVRPEVVDSFAQQFETVEGIRALAAITRDVIGSDPVDGILPAISHQALVLWGTEDRLLRPRWAAKFAEGLPRCELAWMEGCGHELMLEDPRRVAGLIRAFLAR